MKKIKRFFSIMKGAVTGVMEDNVFKLSASLSYYTVFALGPLLLIIISLAGYFYGREAVQGRIFGQINGLVGADAAAQVQTIVANVQEQDQGVIGAIVGAVILIVSATVIFIEMQDSINRIWSVKAKPRKGWLKFITNRLLSFSLIVGLGFMLLVSLIISAILDVLSQQLKAIFQDYTIYLFYVVNLVMVFLVIASVFMVIFKVLPDAHISWKDAFVGAAFTSILFMIGKFAISLYMGQSNLGATYGAAASIMILFTWVYYSSVILYFGAEFTKSYAISAGSGIRPNETAVFVINREAKELDTTPNPELAKKS